MKMKKLVLAGLALLGVPLGTQKAEANPWPEEYPNYDRSYQGGEIQSADSLAERIFTLAKELSQEQKPTAYKENRPSGLNLRSAQDQFRVFIFRPLRSENSVDFYKWQQENDEDIFYKDQGEDKIIGILSTLFELANLTFHGSFRQRQGENVYGEPGDVKNYFDSLVAQFNEGMDYAASGLNIRNIDLEMMERIFADFLRYSEGAVEEGLTNYDLPQGLDFNRDLERYNEETDPFNRFDPRRKRQKNRYPFAGPGTERQYQK